MRDGIFTEEELETAKKKHYQIASYNKITYIPSPINTTIMKYLTEHLLMRLKEKFLK